MPSRAQENRIMKTLVTAHRKAVNRAAHAFALKVELLTRERWLEELTRALEAGATFAEIQQRIATLAEQCRTDEMTGKAGKRENAKSISNIGVQTRMLLKNQLMFRPRQRQI